MVVVLAEVLVAVVLEVVVVLIELVAFDEAFLKLKTLMRFEPPH